MCSCHGYYEICGVPFIQHSLLIIDFIGQQKYILHGRQTDVNVDTYLVQTVFKNVFIISQGSWHVFSKHQIGNVSPFCLQKLT